ncbi:MAG: hypothetical protein HZB80_10850 [Deltaproteobacteria bacterium]|nr:hypothetical protein [Deltaproteobacteria bacterium]
MTLDTMGLKVLTARFYSTLTAPGGCLSGFGLYLELFFSSKRSIANKKKRGAK